ncbi:MAG: hypothetical protein ACI9TH_004947, partial [Kiritimatiellia bacterium]
NHLLEGGNSFLGEARVFPAANIECAQFREGRLGDGEVLFGHAFGVFVVNADDVPVLAQVKIPFDPIGAFGPGEFKRSERIFRSGVGGPAMTYNIHGKSPGIQEAAERE